MNRSSFNILGLVCFAYLLLIPAQTTNSTTKELLKEPVTKSIPKLIDKKTEEKIKDSIMTAFNKQYNDAVNDIYKISRKKLEYQEIKRRREQVIKEYIKVVNKAITAQGRTEKVYVRTVDQSIKQGDLEFIKDSICVKTKTPLFGKQRCVEYTYSFYIVDTKGNKIKL